MNCLQQMLSVYEQTGNSVIAVERVKPEETGKYGIVATQKNEGNKSDIVSIIEKPAPEDAPTNLAVAGRYLLNSDIFHAIENVMPGANGEIQLTDAIAQLLSHQTLHALEFAGKRYDCGSKLGYLQASVVFALQHPDIGADFAEYLHQLHREMDISSSVVSST